jgi:uncharacterized protein YlxW (UPF0749 family)
MQKVRQNIVTQRTKESTLLSQVKKLENNLIELKNSTLNSSDTQLLMNKLSKEKQKVATLNTQIEHYEKKVLSLTKEKHILLSGSQNKKNTENQKNDDSKQETRKLQTKIIELQSKVSKLEARLKPTSY